MASAVIEIGAPGLLACIDLRIRIQNRFFISTFYLPSPSDMRIVWNENVVHEDVREMSKPLACQKTQRRMLT